MYRGNGAGNNLGNEDLIHRARVRKRPGRGRFFREETHPPASKSLTVFRRPRISVTGTLAHRESERSCNMYRGTDASAVTHYSIATVAIFRSV